MCLCVHVTCLNKAVVHVVGRGSHLIVQTELMMMCDSLIRYTYSTQCLCAVGTHLRKMCPCGVEVVVLGSAELESQSRHGFSIFVRSVRVLFAEMMAMTWLVPSNPCS